MRGNVSDRKFLRTEGQYGQRLRKERRQMKEGLGKLPATKNEAVGKSDQAKGKAQLTYGSVNDKLRGK